MSKPFTLIMLCDLVSQYEREEISIVMFNQILNERAEQWHTEQTRWIPVSERLPTNEDADEHGNILVFDYEGYAYTEGWNIKEVERICDIPNLITHWRRIVKP